ncbi:MAG: DUF1223 domain-containing protein [Acidobacteria bacterium]|nr:DUF1223 domain-containing protein [Acidobacteriota bacterium]
MARGRRSNAARASASDNVDSVTCGPVHSDYRPAPADAKEKIGVVIAIAEDGLTSAVKRGENSGRTLAHTAVARRLESIGALDRDAFAGEGQWKLNAAWRPSSLRVIAFLQGQTSHRVYGSAQARLSSPR